MHPTTSQLTRLTLALTAALTLAGCGHLAGRHAHATHGLVSVKSPHSAAETMNRLEAQVKQRNLAVVARINHAAAAQQVGKTLRPTELLIFGNPQAGTPLMECAQGVGIDLPMKGLVSVDAAGQTWLSYNDPGHMVRRHGGRDCPAVETVRKALEGIAQAVVTP
jgi:uncharacterized protein (DUF302 family)